MLQLFTSEGVTGWSFFTWEVACVACGKGCLRHSVILLLAERKKKKSFNKKKALIIIAWEECFLPSLLSAQDSSVKAIFFPLCLQKADWGCQILKSECSEEALIEEGIADGVRPLDLHGFGPSEWKFPMETKWDLYSSVGRTEVVEVVCCNPKTCSLVLKLSSVSLNLPSQNLK